MNERVTHRFTPAGVWVIQEDLDFPGAGSLYFVVDPVRRVRKLHVKVYRYRKPEQRRPMANTWDVCYPGVRRPGVSE